MKKKLTKVGTGWGMLFTKTMIELLDIDPDTDYIEIEFENKTLKMKKIKEETK